MYADVAISTGWTWEYIGQELTLPRLAAMAKHWEQWPPVHKVLAAFAGVKPAGDRPRPAEAEAQPRVLDNAALWRDVKTDPRLIQWQTMD